MKPLVVGVNARRFSRKHFPEDVIENYHETLISWGRWVTSTFACRLVFFPFCEEHPQSDLPAYEMLVSGLEQNGARIEKYEFENFRDLRAHISGCDLFLGVRFHSVLLAAQQCVPVFALSYGENHYRFMKQVGLGEYVSRIEDLTTELLKDRWDMLRQKREFVRERLKVIKQDQRALAAKHFDLISGVIERKS